MKTLDYFFWSIYRWFGKRKYPYPYYFATLALGIIVSIIVISVFDIVPDVVRAEFQKKSVYGYLFSFIYAFIFSLPFKFIFPKKKIENLSYTNEEVERYIQNSVYFVIGFVVLLFLCIVIHRLCTDSSFQIMR